VRSEELSRCRAGDRGVAVQPLSCFPGSITQSTACFCDVDLLLLLLLLCI